MSRPLHSTPQRLKAEKGLPLQRGGLLFLNSTSIGKLKQRGKRRGRLSQLGKRSQRGGALTDKRRRKRKNRVPLAGLVLGRKGGAGKRRRQRGGRILSELAQLPGQDMVRYLRRRYKRGNKRK